MQPKLISKKWYAEPNLVSEMWYVEPNLVSEKWYVENLYFNWNMCETNSASLKAIYQKGLF